VYILVVRSRAVAGWPSACSELEVGSSLGAFGRTWLALHLFMDVRAECDKTSRNCADPAWIRLSFGVSRPGLHCQGKAGGDKAR
jgi:hypothetical protein